MSHQLSLFVKETSPVGYTGDVSAAVSVGPQILALIDAFFKQLLEKFSDAELKRYNGRLDRGLALAKSGTILTTTMPDVYIVPSVTSGHKPYTVVYRKSCTCPDFRDGWRCKHLVAVYLIHQALFSPPAGLPYPEVQLDQLPAPELTETPELPFVDEKEEFAGVVDDYITEQEPEVSNPAPEVAKPEEVAALHPPSIDYIFDDPEKQYKDAIPHLDYLAIHSHTGYVVFGVVGLDVGADYIKEIPVVIEGLCEHCGYLRVRQLITEPGMQPLFPSEYTGEPNFEYSACVPQKDFLFTRVHFAGKQPGYGHNS